MIMRRFVAALFSMIVLAPGAGTVFAAGKEYPNKFIRIVNAAAGGTGDFTTRTLAKGLIDDVGWSVFVDNRPGALSAIETVAKAEPDGYTLLVDSLAFLVGPLKPKIYYDMATDFSPVASVTNSPAVLVVPPSLAAKSVNELIALAKASPGKLNYASTGTGGISHLSAEMFKSMAGVNIVQVPYKATSQALTEVISGRVQVMFVPTGPAAPHIKSAKLRALAVTGARPSPLLLGVQTVAATLPGFEATSVVGVYAPPNTPAPIINRLSQEIARVLNRKEVIMRYLSAGVEPASSTPEEFTALIKAETAKWTKVIKDAGIKGN